MITGFGNNVTSNLASDITATQTSFTVMPGTGDMFAGCLTTDLLNESNELEVYAKITLTNDENTVSEICHLLSVSGDTLTVIRGQEGTAAKGWSLNDVVSNFATRGSENNFAQVEHLQTGHFTTAVAGGTENKLTVDLPSTFFVNGGTSWQLKTPLMILPGLTNTGTTTIQLSFGGKVVGTFPVIKGSADQLDAGDIVAGVPILCLLDSTQSFFQIANPVGYGALLAKYLPLTGGELTGPLTVDGNVDIAGDLRIYDADDNEHGRLSYDSSGKIRLINDTAGIAIDLLNSGMVVLPVVSGKLSIGENNTGLSFGGAKQLLMLSGNTAVVRVSADGDALQGLNVIYGGLFDNGNRAYSKTNPPTTMASSNNGEQWYDNNTDLIIQSGHVGNDNAAVTFWAPFPTALIALVITPGLDNSDGGSASYTNDSVNGFTPHTNGNSFRWVAIGK